MSHNGSKKIPKDPSDAGILEPSFYMYSRKASRAMGLVRDYAVLCLFLLAGIMLYDLFKGNFNYLESLEVNISNCILVFKKIFSPLLPSLLIGLLSFALFETTSNIFIFKRKEELTIAPYCARRNFSSAYLRLYLLLLLIVGGFFVASSYSPPEGQTIVRVIIILTFLMNLLSPSRGSGSHYWLGAFNMIVFQFVTYLF